MKCKLLLWILILAPYNVISCNPFAYVTNSSSTGTVSVIDLETNTVVETIEVGPYPSDIAITPDKEKAYVVNQGNNSVTPIDLSTNTPEDPIEFDESIPSNSLNTIAITSDSATAYVVNISLNVITPIDLATGDLGTDIPAGVSPQAIALSSDDTTAYVTNIGGTVTIINLEDGSTIATVTVGSAPLGIVVTPDDSTAYVTNYSSTHLTKIDLTDPLFGTTDINGIGFTANGIVLNTDGTMAYITKYSNPESKVLVVNLATTNIDNDIPLASGAGPVSLALSPDGLSAYTVDFGLDTVTPINLESGELRDPIPVGADPTAIAIVAFNPLTASGFSRENSFLNRTDRVLTVVWKSNPFLQMQSHHYNLYNNGVLIAQAGVSYPIYFVLPSLDTRLDTVTIAAVSNDGTLSDPIGVTMYP